MTAAAAIADGGYDHAVNVAGGLHHSGPRAASGFCVYNDIGVAISWLLEQGASGSPTSTSTPITVTVCRRSSGTSQG